MIINRLKYLNRFFIPHSTKIPVSELNWIVVRFTGEEFDSIIKGEYKLLEFDLKKGYTVFLENKQTGEIKELCLKS